MTRMKDSGIEWIGEVPEEWGIKKLSQFFSEHKLKNLGNIEQNLLSLSYGKIVRKSIKSSVGLLPESFETYNIIDSNDIVLRLTDLQNDKRSLRTGLANERGIITSAYLTIRLIDGNDSAKYYHYLLHSYDKCKVFYNFGGGVRQGGTWDDLSVLKMIVPPKDEQTKIADFLDKKVAQLDKVKSLLEEQIKTLEDYRQSLIYETVTKGLDKTVPLKDSGVDWMGQIPEGWGVKSIKHIFDVIGSGTTPDSSKTEYYDGDINWLQSGDLYKTDYVDSVSKTITELGYLSSASLKIYEAPFLAIAMYGASIGNLAISKIDACVNQAVVVLKGKEDTVRFVKFGLEISKSELIFAAQGGTQPNINQVLIKNWLIPFPGEIEIREIADFLDKKTEQINQMIAIKKEQIENINKQRQTLIYDYVTGKRRV
ncbi:restriction endonuclease subunit S [Streptococcus parasuis]|uniref:restriction endonuclease subunit S n=1 Tax=Streptococcus parasuis TaxID=1501662 RepID=UPI001C1F93FE|nr:restriction endonuclease subunit S [Streptococcus parasuis]QWV85984.1 restriction endonuclease subunit S [Streptococcus parasuis]